jgi:hypothetical protein
MSRATLALAVGTTLIASCFPPGVSGPGFRLAPEAIRGARWSELESKLHATLTVVDEFHGTRVYVVQLPEGRIRETYLPFVDALDACPLSGGSGAFVLLRDGRIVRTTDDLEAKPFYAGSGTLEPGSSIALSPDGTTIALLHRRGNDDWSRSKPYQLTLVDVASGRSSDLPGEFGASRPCWAGGGKSIFVVEPAGDILQCSLATEERARTVAQGRFPCLSEDGSWLIFLPSEGTYREWNGVDWIYLAALMRWRIGTSEQPEKLCQFTASSQCALAVSKDGWIVHRSAPEERLPLEHSGHFMTGPYWRGGIAVTDPATGTTEPLFVGIAPHSVQWRWDD